MAISDNIKKFRKQLGISQQELADKAGISRISVGNYERGDRLPNSDIIQKIANALSIDVNTLLMDDEDPILRTLLQQENYENDDFYQAYIRGKYTGQIHIEAIDVFLLKDYHKLNEIGQERVRLYLADLLKIEEYRNKQDT